MSSTPPSPHRTALVLAGGGISGVAYEIGALRALNDLLVGQTVNDFDVYVGTSAGSIVSTLLAEGVTPEEMALAFKPNGGPFAAPTRRGIYRPNSKEFGRRLWGAPKILGQLAWDTARHPSSLASIDIVGRLGPLLPSGLFDPQGMRNYMRDIMERRGLTDNFLELEKELHIVACELDTDKRVVFSARRHASVPISSAVAASSAIPLLFRPLTIDGVDYVDGGMKGISAVDVAVERGAQLIVVINPVVPLDSSHHAASLSNALPKEMVPQPTEHLADLGLRAVYNQVFRGILYDGLHDHIKLIRNDHPEIDIVLIQPRPDDVKMFFHELMSFSARLMVLQHGYESVSSGLYETWGYLRRVLPRHGIHITRRVLEQRLVDVPVESVTAPGRLQRLMRDTVFARRPHLHVVDDEAS